METESKNYEIDFLAKSEENRKGIIEILKKYQLSVINEGKISKIKLAFPVKKENFAYLGHLSFSGHPQDVKNLSDQLKTNIEILRFLIVHQPIVKESESEAAEQTPLTQTKHLSERQKNSPVRNGISNGARETEKISKTEVLSNEALEKKLEEILK
jgi:ribosomal protein S6